MGAICTYGREIEATQKTKAQSPPNIYTDQNNGGADVIVKSNSSRIVKSVRFPKDPESPLKRSNQGERPLTSILVNSFANQNTQQQAIQKNEPKPKSNKRRGYQKEKPKNCVLLEEVNWVPDVKCWLLTRQGWHLAKIIHVESKKITFELGDGFGTKRVIYKNQVKTRVLQICKPKPKNNISVEDIPAKKFIEKAEELMEDTENFEDLTIQEGFMMKLNPHGKSQERYFKLKTDSVLYYYQHQHDTKEKGELPLADMLDIKNIPDKGDGSFYFQIEMQNSSRLWKFGCLEESIRNEWVEVIKKNAPIQKIMKEGFLYKATESIIATGHARYFVLKYNLEYYKDEKKEKYLGKIDINDIEKQEEVETGGTKARKFGIKFHTTGASGRVWRLFAATTEERKYWVEAINDQRELNSLKYKTTFGLQASRIYSTDKSRRYGSN